MNTITKILTGIILIISFGLTAQVTNENETKPYIEVTGVAELEIVPDQIFITIVLKEKDKESIEVQEEKLKTALKEIGVDIKNLYLSDAKSNYMRPSAFKAKDVITSKQYTLKVSDAKMVGKVFQQLDKLDITNADLSDVNHSKIDSLKKEVRIMAIKAAKAKADYLLAAIGEQTGKPLQVQETDIPIKNNSYLNGLYGSRSANNVVFIEDGVPVEDNILFLKMKIESSIYVKFLIK